MKLSACAVVAAVIALAGTAGPAAAASHPAAAPYATISGSGSLWQSVLIDQWAADVEAKGLTVNFLPDGSAAGRGDYLQGSQVDFAMSDVAFPDGHDKLAGTPRETVPWGYSYIPGAAGAVSFLYHLSVHGRMITNLRLSASTLAGIFTGRITNWDSPQITRDNGRRLPNLRITAVVRQDGAGTTFFFTRWMARMFPGQWNAFCARVTRGRVKPPCGPTSLYPSSGPGWHPKAEIGSNNVATYIHSSSGQGSIGYDESSVTHYAHLPAAQIRNPGGRYVQPGSLNITTALTRATVNENPRGPDFLQENLNGVYTYKNPLSYPLAYYGYWIVPRAGTKIPPIFNNAAGRSLSTFIAFGLCSGNRQAAALGYAALPRNLVAAGLAEIGHIPGHIAVPSLSRCDRLPI